MGEKGRKGTQIGEEMERGKRSRGEEEDEDRVENYSGDAHPSGNRHLWRWLLLLLLPVAKPLGLPSGLGGGPGRRSGSGISGLGGDWLRCST